MQMVISFPGGARVDAKFDSFTARTDQPPQGGGEGSAPTPFATLPASIGACAGIYLLGFYRQRQLPTDGIRIVQRLDVDRATGMVATIRLGIHLPPGFPEKGHAASIRSAERCAVKKHREPPLKFQVTIATNA
jgi:putative redox protein